MSGPLETSMPVVSTQVILSGPPVKVDEDGDQEVYATTKQEEWITSKRVQSTTKKHIETRVKRQVLLEDGQVVQDSGPEVITNVTENTDTHQNNAEEHQTSGDDPSSNHLAVTLQDSPRRKTHKKEKKVNTHEEYVDITREDTIENLGDLTNDELVWALREKSDVRLALAKRQDSTTDRQKRAKYHTSHHHKTIDTEDVNEKQEVREDGEVVTETTRTKQWEEYDNEQVPDSGSSESQPEDTKETSHKMVHTKDENIIEYVAVPRGATLAQGVKVGEGMRYVSENIQEDKTGNQEEMDALMDHRAKRHKKLGLIDKSGKMETVERKDALTKKPLDFDEEEETRKLETSRWLESHFGSDESYKSHTSVCDEEEPREPVYGGNVIKITMGGARPRPTNKSPPQRTESFFQGISQWDKGENRQYKTETDIKRERKHSSPRETPLSSPKNNIGLPQYESTPVKTYSNEPKSPPNKSYTHEITSSPIKKFANEPKPPPPYSPPPPPIEENVYKPWQRKNPIKYGPLRQEYNRIVEELKNEERMKTNFSRLSKDEKVSNGTTEAVPKSVPPPPKRPERRKPNRNGGSSQTRNSETNHKTDIKHTNHVSSSHKESSNVSKENVQSKTKPIDESMAKFHKRYYDPSWQATVDSGTQTSETREISTQTLYKPMKKYYLGEDPFQGGMFRGAPTRHKKLLHTRRRGSVDDALNERTSETLGRHTRSTTKEKQVYNNEQGVRSQTLPRRLKSASPNRKFYYGDNRGTLNNSELDRSLNSTKIGGSMINVSIVNNVKNERKPSVNRSQSFNVSSPSVSVLKRTPRPTHLNKSTPHLSDATPLRSPDVLKGISRSSSMRQDLHYTEEAVPTNGVKDTKKKTFLQGLLNTAPELYYHLHGDDELKQTRTPPDSTTPPDSPPALIYPEELPMSQKIHMYEAKKVESPFYKRFSQEPQRKQITKSTPNLVHSVSMRTSSGPTYRGISHSPSFNSWSRTTNKKEADTVRIVEEAHSKKSMPLDNGYKPTHTPAGGVIIQVRDWNSR